MSQEGYPVVLKVVSPDVVHRSDVGGVVVGLEDAQAVRAAYQDILAAQDAEVDVQGVLVCRHAPKGLEVIVGALEDGMFGPTVMFGMGGIFTEVLRDVSFCIAPLERADAEAMVREIRGYPLLTGVRGHPGYDVGQTKWF